MCTKNPGPKKKGGHKITWIRRFPIRQVWQGRRILLKSLARACCVWKIERSTSFSKSSHLCFESQTVYCALCAALYCCPGKRPNWTSGLAGLTYGTVWSRLWRGVTAMTGLWSLITYMIMYSWKFPQTQPERHLAVLLSSENPRRSSSLFTTMHGVAPTANSSAKKHWKLLTTFDYNCYIF